MHVNNTVITGGGGFLGQRLARMIDGPVTVIDQGFPPDVAGLPVSADLGSSAPFALPPDTTVIFHLAAVVSSGAEADFDLGMAVNIDGTRRVLEACRALANPPIVVFASSVAAYGGPLPAVVDDDTRPTPMSSYGAQKVIVEYLVADYTRKGFIRGISLRLPTVVVRPGKPNLAASSFASGIIREPLVGVRAACPVAAETELWITSPDRVIASLVEAASLPSDVWPAGRVVNLPGLTVSVTEMLASLETVGGATARALVDFVPDERIASIVAGWPARFSTAVADRLGFVADASFEDVVRQYTATN